MKMQNEIGFEILEAKQALKLKLDRAGPAGLGSFIEACIASGKNQLETILEEVLAVTGVHALLNVHREIAKGEQVRWVSYDDGTLGLIGNER